MVLDGSQKYQYSFLFEIIFLLTAFYTQDITYS
jgi:hypothetical protein